jgi:thioredoxin-like negative regulator of GroEL
MPSGLLESLRAAVESAPEDIPLRLHLAELLTARGERDEAVRQAAAVLQRDPGNEAALRLLAVDAPLSAPPTADGEREFDMTI